MTANKAADGLGHRKGDHEMVYRQLLGKPLGQPLAGFISLTVGAMPVAAATKYGMALAAIVAPKKRRTIMLGSAVDDGIDDVAMVCRHVV